MKVAILEKGNEITLKLKGVNRFYALNHELVLEAGNTQLEGSASTVNIDMKAIDYIDSSAFNTILKLHRYSKELGKELVLMNVSEATMDLFDSLKLRDVLNFTTQEGNTVSDTVGA